MRAVFFLTIALLIYPSQAFAQLPIRDGIKEIYYDSGELRAKVPYKNGKKNGIEQHFDRTGKVISEYYYENGEKLGEMDHPVTTRDFGNLSFLGSWKFWGILLTILVGLWFLISRILLRKTAF